MRFIGAEELRSTVSIPDAIAALEEAFAGSNEVEAPQRWHLDAGGDDLLLMPAWGAGSLGVKLVTVASRPRASAIPSVQGVYVLFDAETLAPITAIDGSALTGLRTSAVSALATKHLARSGSQHLVVFGAGTQARWHIEAMRAVLPITRVTIVSRTEDSAASLVGGLEGVDASVGDESAAREADVICLCTTSPEPVISDGSVPDGIHINAVGAYKPDRREIGSETMARGRVVVEEREAALEEAGDLIIPIAEGAFDDSHIVADLHELVTGTMVRRAEDDVTIFKSVGSAFEDLIVARLTRQ